MHHDESSSTPPEADDAWIEKLLRERSSRSSGHDDEAASVFSARVLAALPPPAAGAARRASLRRTLSIALGAALGLAAVAAFGGESTLEAFRATSQLATQAAEHIQRPGTPTAHVLAALSFLAMMLVALRRGWRRLLS